MGVLSYSPSHCDPGLLDRITTGASRRELLDTLIGVVRDEVGRTSHQHQLLVGPRGMGKTHLLALLVSRLEADADLGKTVLPLVLPEEEVVRQPADLMIKVLRRLHLRLGSDGCVAAAPGAVADARERVAAALERLHNMRDNEAALQLAMGAIEQASRDLGVLLVPVVENLDSVLYAGPGGSRGKAAEAHWALRSALQEAKGTLLLAAAPTWFGEVARQGAAFHGFFREHRIPELSGDEMLQLIRRRLDEELATGGQDPRRHRRLLAFGADFEQRAPTLRGLLTYTGGLPRFGHLIFDLVIETDAADIADMLSRFLDEQTPYFQARLDPRVIPEAELEVLDVLGCAEGPMAPADIARQLRGGSSNAVNTYLGRLKERGLVRERRLGKRAVRYDVSEPLFRVWRRFRVGRSERERIVVLAQFVAAVYTRVELLAERSTLAEPQTSTFRARLLDAALDLHRPQQHSPAQNEPGVGFLGEDTDPLMKEAEQEFLTGSVTRAHELYRKVVQILDRAEGQHRLVRALSRLSHVAFLAGHPGEALEAADRGLALATELGDDQGRARCIRGRGDVLFRLGRNDDALASYDRAETLFGKVGSDLGRGNCIFGRGEVLFQLGRNDEALASYDHAETLYDKVGDDLGRASCIASRARVAASRGRVREAGERLVQVHAMARAVGDRHNADLFGAWAMETLADHPRTLIDPQGRDLLERLAPILAEAGGREPIRAALVALAAAVVRDLETADQPGVLARLEAGLPASHATLLRPARLAVGVLAGDMPADLPDEPEEVRRAVRDFMEMVKSESGPKSEPESEPEPPG